MITAAVLAGGLGTRLRSVLPARPKVLAPVAGRHFLAYLLDQLSDAGIKQVVLCTGHLGDQVTAAFGRSWRKLHLQYSCEPQPMGTAGALRYALDRFSSANVLVLNGDSYCDVDLSSLASSHEQQGAAATLALTDAPDVNRYGAVDCDSTGAIRGFAEKGSAGPGLINAGIYVLSRQVIESIPAGLPASLERDCFPALIGKGLYGYRAGKRFVDIGTPASLQEAQLFFAHSAGSRNGVQRRPYVLLDRDGTINVERNYLSEPDQLKLLPGVVQGMRRLRQLGMGLAIVSNQSALGRSYFDLAQLERVHDRLRAMLGAEDVAVDGIYYCPHVPEAGCDCRKPQIGMFEQASADLGFNSACCFVIGDKLCDIEMGKRVGATTFLVRTGHGLKSESDGVRADHIVNTVNDAAGVIEDLLQNGSMRLEGRDCSGI